MGLRRSWVRRGFGDSVVDDVVRGGGGVDGGDLEGKLGRGLKGFVFFED